MLKNSNNHKMSSPNLSWLKSGSSFKPQAKRVTPSVVEEHLVDDYSISEKKQKLDLNTIISSSESELDDVESIEDDKDKYDIEESFISASNNSTPPSFTSDKIFEDRKADRDNLIIDSMYSGDSCIYKKSKVILGMSSLPAYIQDSLQQSKKGKSTRYFQDTHMLTLNSVSRQFAYDQIRLYNKQNHIELDYTTQDEKDNQIPFIPFSMNLEGNGSVSKIDLQDRLIQHYNHALDEDPQNLQLWMKYCLVYEELADNAESKKERMAMLQMEYELIQDALKKLPQSMKLKNALMNVVLKLKTGDELNSLLTDISSHSLNNGNVVFTFLQYKLSQLSTYSYQSSLQLFQETLSQLNLHYQTLLRSGCDETVIREFQQIQLAVVYMFVCIEKARGGFHRGFQLLCLLFEYNLNVPAIAKGKASSYKKQLFESYFIANNMKLIGNPHYRSWKDWIVEQMKKMGKNSFEEERKHEESPVELIIHKLSALNNQIITYVKEKPLTPWPCHQPTEKEIEQVQTEDKSMPYQLDSEVLNSEDYNYVYSTVHGYRIPIPKKNEETDYYKQILNAIRDVQTDEVSEKKKKKVKVQSIQSDDLFNNWLHEEEFDDIQSNFDMTEIEENSNTSFSYHDLEPLLITLTPSLYHDLFMLMLQYLGIEMKAQSCPLYNRVHQLTLSSDEGIFSLLADDSSLLSSLKHPLPISLSSQVFQDERCQQVIRCLFSWYFSHIPSPSFSIIIAHVYYECILARTNQNKQQEDLAIQLAKSFLQLPSNRNDLRFYMLYIDVCEYCGRYEEAQRIAQGSLKLLPRLGTSAQRYLPCILRRIIESKFDEEGEITEVNETRCKEVVILWKTKTIQEGMKLLQQYLLPDEKDRSNQQLERKLIYLLKKESDYHKQLNSPEVDSCYLDIACLLTLVYYLDYGVEGISSASQYVFSFYKPSEQEDYPIDSCITAYHHYLLYLLYNHSLLQYVFLSVHSTLSSSPYYTDSIKQHLLLPKQFLHQQIIASLRDCPDNPLFLVLLYKHNNVSLFAGPLQQYFNYYIKGMENSFILPENKPSEQMAVLLVFLFTSVVLQKSQFSTNDKTSLPHTHYIRSMYDRLLRIPYLSTSTLLWRSYLYYEYHSGSYNNAIHVFYNAINKCPYSKVLWTDAIRILRPLMKNDELVNILSYCQSKDIILNNSINLEESM